jgi:hypothetical protein
MDLIVLQRRHQHGDPTNGIPPENLKYKCKKTCLKVFPYEIYRLYDKDKSWIQMWNIQKLKALRLILRA